MKDLEREFLAYVAQQIALSRESPSPHSDMRSTEKALLNSFNVFIESRDAEHEAVRVGTEDYAKGFAAGFAKGHAEAGGQSKPLQAIFGSRKKT